MPVSEIKFVEAYRAANSPQAHAIRFALEDAGLRVLIENESLQDGIGEIPYGWPAAPRIRVEESQLAAAREFIGRIDHGSTSALNLTRSETARCLACDAIMTEAETACPKCGWSYEPGGSAEPV